MMTFDESIIVNKLSRIAQVLLDLKKARPKSFLAYTEDIITKSAVERMLEKLVELAVDINNHILVQKLHKPSADYFSSFILLAKEKVLSSGLADKIAHSAGLRNRIVHEYDDLDDKIVYDSINIAIVQYTEYVAEINKYLK